MVNSTKRFILSLALLFALVLYRLFSIAITSLGEERVGLCAFHAFLVLHLLVCVSFFFFLVSEIGCDL